MKLPSAPRIMMASCILALVALAMIVWSLLDPRPIPVIVAMSVGQALGTMSFGAYLVVIVGDLRARYKEVAPRDRAASVASTDGKSAS